MRHIIGLICLAAFFALLITGCSKAPGSVIEDFYNAKTWDERKAFILDANGLKEKDVYDESTNYIIEDIVLLKNVDETSLVYKVVFKSEGDKKRIKRFLITKVGEDEKIDFKTTIGFNEINFRQYIERNTAEPARLWVKVGMGTKYLYPIGTLKVVELYDDNNTVYIAMTKENESVDVTEKLKDIALNKKDVRVLIEIAQIMYQDPLGQEYYIGAKNVKIIKLNPLDEE